MLKNYKLKEILTIFKNIINDLNLESLSMREKAEEFLVNKIRSQYIQNDKKELDELVNLDKKVKLQPTILAYVLGTIGALIMGFGMSLTMTNIGTALGINNTMLIGTILGIIGIIICVINYPIYNKYLGVRKAKYSTEILRLTDKLQRNLGD